MIVVGIAGGSGSGKSTVCRRLQDLISSESVVLHHDNYYRCLSEMSEPERAVVNFDHPEALETDQLCQHLDRLRSGESIEMPTYCFERHVRASDVQVIAPAEVVFVDGVMVLSESSLRERCDVKIYVHADEAIRLKRRIARDSVQRGRTRASVMAQWKNTVLPMHQTFVEPARQFADFELGNSVSEPDLADVLQRLRG